MPKFTVEFEYPPPRDVTKALAALLRKPPQSGIQLVDPLEEGGLVVRVNCESDNARSAVEAAHRLVTAQLTRAPAAVATHPVRGIRATSFDKYDRFVALVGIAEIAELFGVTRQRASVLARSASFPWPIQILRMGPVFSRRAVLRHRNQRHFRIP